jgi:Cellulase (glycosyl hydrolase family 5)
MHVRRACIGTLAALLCVLALMAPGATAASHPFQTALQDAAVFANDPANTNIAMMRMRQAGASWVRIDLSWDNVAPQGAVKPPGFDASNPADPLYQWGRVDWAVQRAAANGLSPFVNISEAPAWAERGHAGRPGVTDPNPTELAAFARAAALRYSGRYAGLPRVPAWEIWNEVNASFFFAPQWKDKPGGEAFSPAAYRQMVNEFEAAVHSVSPDDLIVAGSLYPFALDRPNLQAIPPLEFMRLLFCLTKKLEVIPNCGEPLHFDVFSHHPYTSGDPGHQTAGPDSVSIAQLPRMGRILRAAIKQGRVVSRRPVQFWVTEFGWDTNPPDPQGVPVRLQARWISEAFYRMWKAGVTVASWFQMRDGYGDSARFQDGLYRVCPNDPENVGCDKAKLSFESFRFPFVAFRGRRFVSVWGLRPGGVPGKVVIERSGKGGWKTLERLTTDRYGIFQRKFRTRRRGSYRVRLPDRSVYSLPFSLKRPRDFPISPPVG